MTRVCLTYAVGGDLVPIAYHTEVEAEGVREQVEELLQGAGFVIAGARPGPFHNQDEVRDVYVGPTPNLLFAEVFDV